jgi:hypothetical protein
VRRGRLHLGVALLVTSYFAESYLAESYFAESYLAESYLTESYRRIIPPLPHHILLPYPTLLHDY